MNGDQAAIVGFLRGNRGKLGLALVVLLAAAVTLFMQLRGSRRLSNTVSFACVATGKIYDIDRSQIKAVPLANPKTGERTLLPCVKEDGVYYISTRYRDSLLRLGEKNSHVDPETLAVRSEP